MHMQFGPYRIVHSFCVKKTSLARLTVIFISAQCLGHCVCIEAAALDFIWGNKRELKSASLQSGTLCVYVCLNTSAVLTFAKQVWLVSPLLRQFVQSYWQ